MPGRPVAQCPLDVGPPSDGLLVRSLLLQVLPVVVVPVFVVLCRLWMFGVADLRSAILNGLARVPQVKAAN
jgi:hypothetical protein